MSLCLINKWIDWKKNIYVSLIAGYLRFSPATTVEPEGWMTEYVIESSISLDLPGLIPILIIMYDLK